MFGRGAIGRTNPGLKKVNRRLTEGRRALSVRLAGIEGGIECALCAVAVGDGDGGLRGAFDAVPASVHRKVDAAVVAAQHKAATLGERAHAAVAGHRAEAGGGGGAGEFRP